MVMNYIMENTTNLSRQPQSSVSGKVHVNGVGPVHHKTTFNGAGDISGINMKTPHVAAHVTFGTMGESTSISLRELGKSAVDIKLNPDGTVNVLQNGTSAKNDVAKAALQVGIDLISHPAYLHEISQGLAGGMPQALQASQKAGTSMKAALANVELQAAILPQQRVGFGRGYYRGGLAVPSVSASPTATPALDRKAESPKTTWAPPHPGGR